MIDEAVAAIQSGKPVVLPTDTVYGLATSPYSESYTRRIYRLKGRDGTKPTALVAADLDWLFECVPELRGRAGVIARALLPGPYTLILPNPARRFRWVTGTTPGAIGIRVPELEGPGAEVLRRVGAVVATSANKAGGPDPSSASFPERRRRCWTSPARSRASSARARRRRPRRSSAPRRPSPSSASSSARNRND